MTAVLQLADKMILGDRTTSERLTSCNNLHIITSYESRCMCNSWVLHLYYGEKEIIVYVLMRNRRDRVRAGPWNHSRQPAGPKVLDQLFLYLENWWRELFWAGWVRRWISFSDFIAAVSHACVHVYSILLPVPTTTIARRSLPPCRLRAAKQLHLRPMRLTYTHSWPIY